MTYLAISPDIITRSLNQVVIGQRAHDGYIHATALCKAASREWKHYHANETTSEFLQELAGSVGIPTDLLVQTIANGPNDGRGTWVHPKVAIHLGMWCSATFAVQVVTWVEQWYRTHQLPIIGQALDPIRIKIENFTAIIQLRERLGMKADRNVHLAIEALQG